MSVCARYCSLLSPSLALFRSCAHLLTRGCVRAAMFLHAIIPFDEDEELEAEEAEPVKTVESPAVPMVTSTPALPAPPSLLAHEQTSDDALARATRTRMRTGDPVPPYHGGPDDGPAHELHASGRRGVALLFYPGTRRTPDVDEWICMNVIRAHLHLRVRGEDMRKTTRRPSRVACHGPRRPRSG